MGVATPVASVEWMALLLCIVAAGGAAFSYVIAHIAIGLKPARRYVSGEESGETLAPSPLPRFYAEEAVLFARSCSSVLAATGFWLAWRQGFRAEMGVLNLDIHTAPGADTKFFLNLGFLLYVLLSSVQGVGFFAIGIKRGWMGLVVLLDVASFAFLVLSLVYSFLIWWVAGVVMVCGVALTVYTLIMSFAIWNLGAHLFLNSPSKILEDILEHVKTDVRNLRDSITRRKHSEDSQPQYSQVQDEAYAVQQNSNNVINRGKSVSNSFTQAYAQTQSPSVATIKFGPQ